MEASPGLQLIPLFLGGRQNALIGGRAASQAGFGKETKPVVTWWSSLKLWEGPPPLRQPCLAGVTWIWKRDSIGLTEQGPHPGQPLLPSPTQSPQSKLIHVSCLTEAAATVPTQSPNVKVIHS